MVCDRTSFRQGQSSPRWNRISRVANPQRAIANTLVIWYDIRGVANLVRDLSWEELDERADDLCAAPDSKVALEHLVTTATANPSTPTDSWHVVDPTVRRV